MTVSRQTRLLGIGSGASYKDTGRRKTIILAITPVSESYENLSIILSKCVLSDDFIFCGDLKVIRLH